MKKVYFLICLLIVNLSFANIVVPSVFSDHMVLQQNDEVKFWGWADPNEEVILKTSWSDVEYKTKGSTQAYWELKINTPSAGGPFTITIKGNNVIVIKDILIGEVWLCSGQSNMEMSADWGIDNGEQEINNANYPNIRFYTIQKKGAKFPQQDINANWNVCTPETMKSNSSLAYFFAQRLQEKIPDVPIGLIVSAWGGTPAEIWMPEEVFKNDSILLNAANKLKPVQWGPIEPARAFNAMIHPLIGYNIAGALWYQGEANVGAPNYDYTLTSLIKSWRDLWRKDFPFYFVQIAPYKYGTHHHGGAEIRDAQRKVSMQIPNTAMVVISDISPIDDIHPKDKRSVGIRLANLALAKHYKKNTDLVESPLFKDISIDKDKITIYFDHADGLYFNNKEQLFEVAGADEKFYFARAKIVKQTVIIRSSKIKHPKKVRFAWGNTVKSNLFNNAKLPASTFTTE